MNTSTEAVADGQGEPDPTGTGSSVPDSETQPIQAAHGLRVWPAILLLVVMWMLRNFPFQEASMLAMTSRFMVPLACSGLLILWWLFLSRASWKEKLAGLAGLAAIAVVSTMIADKSIRGFGTLMFAIPWGISAFALFLVVFRGAAYRCGLGLLGAVLGFGYWDLVRTDEIRGDFAVSQSWRWEPTPEDRLVGRLAELETTGRSLAEDWECPAEPEWPEFRGPARDGSQPAVVLAEDWDANPPEELWRRPVGPGWSSFSIAGGRLFTQEQRGEGEFVVCYSADSGDQIWAHEVKTRFWEVVGGAGPRATPTLSNCRLFSLGANGNLCCLDPVDGSLVWTRDIREDSQREPPQWGFASSPLVHNGLVIIHAGGEADRGILAYDSANGEPRWQVKSGDHSYSSPQAAMIGDAEYVLMLTNDGLSIVDPHSGELVSEYQWPYEGYRVVQPLVLEDSILLGSAMGGGTRRIRLATDGDDLTSELEWETSRMNPYYNDYVAHNGSLYGFDNNIFACVDLETGERQWKRGRYGNGQVLLLPAGEQLLVISEDGELVLLRATPDAHEELTRVSVLDGRTWNHPVLVDDRLYVRNAEEAACFRMPLAIER